MPEFKKFPYRSEFPDSSESGRNHQSLEDAISWSRWTVDSRWKETDEETIAGEYIHDAERAIITNRNTGYRWILRRGKHEIAFQTPGMFEGLVGEQGIEPSLTVYEAEALARAAKSLCHPLGRGIVPGATFTVAPHATDEAAGDCAVTVDVE